MEASREAVVDGKKNKLLMLLIATIALLWSPGSCSARRVRNDPEDSANSSNSTTLPQQLGAEEQASVRAIIQSGNLLKCFYAPSDRSGRGNTAAKHVERK